LIAKLCGEKVNLEKLMRETEEEKEKESQITKAVKLK